jgi:hypothetical protein
VEFLLKDLMAITLQDKVSGSGNTRLIKTADQIQNNL